MRHCNNLLTVLLLFNLAACGDSNTSSPPSSTIEPKLSSIQSQVFNLSCGTPSCHGGNAGDMTLTSGNAYNQLVNQQSIGDHDHTPPFLRVKPGKPDSSFLIIKLTNPTSNQGDLMPKNTGGLSSDKIEAIRTWILNGAHND